ncbi:hypothetical protein Kpol_1062p30 [Vanderwaltozyma polyspora DSM 70294]|uniref:Inositol phosphorylceramide synthase regulatory subunit KEI1 n=1 Tax=Vanderwaltozyma polyspora (strain ATCC 22028 / DSM 70294 / BCRC 21397 / CBS 2163 / NBRC 10782 / NRRL Y-8283 / UCD 57-17) TaxID=436907 RepID=A7TK87_VANPO|nr:uncharacterized protein Kpol_1062p30 [Vanderwaltozyma polyspora DSM 70294]EDO17322.1 hypothetical protein Kpol_1062p30 [Vanderwaltozyma polyspora DSM 70294]
MNINQELSRVKTHYSNLPRSFFGFLPLYIGVETVLGITILNKCSGAYGILALFTGHPLNVFQWVSYLWSVFTLIIYSQGLFQVHTPSLLTYSQIFVVFSFDTFLTCVFTMIFSSQWFTETGSGMSDGSGVDEYGQGASETYEYTFTILITVVALVSRMYFNFILAAFNQELFLHPKYMVDFDDVEQDLKNKNKIVQWWIKSKKSCYNLARHILT